MLSLFLCESLNFELLQELGVGVLQSSHLLLNFCLCFFLLFQFNVFFSIIQHLVWSRNWNFILHPSLLELSRNWFCIWDFLLRYFLLILLHHFLHSPI